MQHKVAVDYFNEPVDPVALGIPEYFETVKVRNQWGMLGFVLDVNLWLRINLGNPSLLGMHLIWGARQAR